MLAVWDSGMPTDTAEAQDHYVASAAAFGFDTVIARAVDTSFQARANDAGLAAIQIVTPYVDEAFAAEHPACMQQVTDAERGFGEVVSAHPWNVQTDRAFRWFPHVNTGRWPCLRHDQARDEIRRRIERALASADGIALDGFGYVNHYACWCEVCERHLEAERRDGERELDALARVSEDHLVEVSEFVTEHAKAVKTDCIVTNHLWPPFRPNWYYGWRLRMDYCCQTISWYHRPVWSLSRTRFEAEEHKRLEDPSRNRFVPFVAVYDRPEAVRSAEQVRAEVEIGIEASGGHLCFSTLKTLLSHSGVGKAVREAIEASP